MSTNRDERSAAGSVLGRHSAKRRLGHLTEAEKSEAMRQVRLSKILKIAARLRRERPASSNAWQMTNAAFLDQNESNKKGRN